MIQAVPNSSWPPRGVHLAWRTNDAGRIVLPPVLEHRVNVHGSERTPSSCPASGFRYVRERGDVDVTPSGETSAHDAEVPSRTLELRISPGLLERVADELGTPRERAGLASRKLVRDARLAHIAWALEEESRSPAPLGALYIDSLGVALAVHLLGQHSAVRNAKEPSGLDALQLQRVIDYVEAHLDTALSLATLARVAGVSSAHLRHWFKAKMGLPVHRYVVHRRVERARVLLLQRTMPASEVALAAGFAHQTHMARWLRRELGVTPRELVRRHHFPDSRCA
ncbi:MAG: transcriptional regulator, AraC family [Labilithrix sp.]|nr:transcriptional regulator, AraC family [Labilithrix sp.]